MLWLIVSSIGYLLNAISIAINKALLSKDIPSPSVMAMLIAILGMITIVLIPFGVTLLSLNTLLISLLAGSTFVAAIYTMFFALQKGEASNIPAFIGGFQPIILFIIAAFFLGEQLTNNQLTGFIFLALGGLVIALKKSRYSKKILLIAFLSSIFFAVSFAATKYVFNVSDFINGLFWTRLGAFLAALIMLTNSSSRNEFKKILTRKNEKQNKRATIGFFSAQITGGASFILINYAFSIGSVTLVNALQGIQYIFLFLLVLPLSIFYPKLWKEDLHKKEVLTNLLAIIIISFGLYFIAT